MKNILISLAVILLVLFGTWRISKNDEFQFFGTLINRINTNDKVVALTFDDGPVKRYTNKILEILNNSNTKATFYLVGKSIEQNIESTQSILNNGHEIGNHSYTHTRMVFKSPSFIEEEIEKTNLLIVKAGYKGVIHFRPPYGKKLFLLPYYLSQNNIKTITWDVEPETYLDATASPSEITDYVINNTKPGSIILMHVMFKSRVNSMKAVPMIIQKLKEKGYKFVTVSDLLAREKA